MAEAIWRVGLIDSGVAPGTAVLGSRRFADGPGGVCYETARADPSGHGSAVAAVLQGGAGVQLLAAQVLDGRGRATPAAVAAAIDWTLAEDVHLVHLSLGLAHDRAVLAAAIVRALARGVAVVAAVPARGLQSWPAAYPGVIRATGDARCTPVQISSRLAAADFGGCASAACAGRTLRGASMGAAHVTRFILAHCAPGTVGERLRAELDARAAYLGPERVGARPGHRITSAPPGP